MPHQPLGLGVHKSRLKLIENKKTDLKEHFHSENAITDRSYMAFFTTSSIAFAMKDMVDGLLSDGIPASEVCCLQRSTNSNTLITFASKCYCDFFLRRSFFVVRQSCYGTHPGSRRLLFVMIYDAPHELPDSAIEHRLGKNGRIYSFRRGKVPGYPDVFNCLRDLCMEVDTHIPCFLCFGKFQICIKHAFSSSGAFWAFSQQKQWDLSDRNN